MTSILEDLSQLLPNVKFREATSFYWSPASKTVYYVPGDLSQDPGLWAFLHEAAHAKLDHQTYSSDLELLMLEVTAWDEARNIGESIGIHIDNDHAEDCLDTYRDWLHQRSTCPTCGVVSLQESPSLYRCFNCLATWQISTSRFCRPYRLSQHGDKKKTLPEVQATFHKKV